MGAIIKLKVRRVKFLFMLALLLLSIKNVSSQTYTWDNVSIGAGGFVSSIITSKTQANVMYARTDVGGAYRWDAANNKWIPLNDWASDDQTGYLGVESLALDPQDNSKVYMLVGISYFNGGRTAILRSTDSGNTFSIIDATAQFRAHGNGMGRQTGEKLVVDPNNSNTIYCGTRWNGLFKSTNAGLNWTNLSALGVTTTPNENGLSFVVIDPASGTPGNNSQKIFVGVSRSGSDNFYVSTNGGTTFTAVAGAPTTFMPHRAVLASDGNMYITYGNGAGPHGHWAVPEPMDNGQIWKYNTGTGVWTNVTPAGFARAFGGISIDPGNPNRLVASTINTYMAQYTAPAGTVWGDRFFISTNGGASWTDLVGSGIVLDPNGSSWIYGHSIHWAGSIEFNPFNTNQVWITSGNGVFSCDNINASPTNWKFNVKGLEETVPLDIVSITGGPLVSVIGDYDGFKHMDVTQYPPIHTPRMGTTTGLAYAASNTNKLLRVGNNMYYSTDQGTSWTQCTLNGVKGKVAVSADGNTFLHCPETSTTTYRSTNNGASWTTCNGLTFSEAYPTADPVNTNKFYAYNSGSGVMMVSTDGGANFSNAGSLGTGGSKIIRTVPGREGHLWVPLYGGGLRRSINSGGSFTNITNVTYCAAVGLGKAAPAATYHAIYIWGTVGGIRGVHRSIDEGATWTRVNDDAHEFGGPGNGQFVIGDMNVYGRVYMSTAGRGIVYANTGDPLPVELISFTASFNAQKVVDLNWITSSEIDVKEHRIYKSVDLLSNNWNLIGTVAAVNNSSSIQEYSMQDQELSSGSIVYYKLISVDFDGSISSSKFISISPEGGDHSQVLIYPNPSTHNFNIYIKENHQKIKLSILNAVGQLVELSKFQDEEVFAFGENLTPGIYFVEVQSESEVKIYKIIKE